MFWAKLNLFIDISGIPDQYKTSRESQNATQRTSLQLSRCQNVFTKILFLKFFLLLFILRFFSYFKFCHNLNFWVFLQFEFLSFVTIWVLSQLEFCHNSSFVKIWVFGQNLSLSHFEFLNFITNWVFEFYHHLSF